MLSDKRNTGYTITAYVPPDWASKEFKDIIGHGSVGLTTYHDSKVDKVTFRGHPEFVRNFSRLVTTCANKEKDHTEKIQKKIEALMEQKAKYEQMLEINKNAGKKV